MEEIQIISNRKDINNINEDELSNEKKLLLNLLNNYTYEDIMNCIFAQEKKSFDDDLNLKLKELVNKIDIEELAKLLTKTEINNLLYIKNKRDHQIPISLKENRALDLELHLKEENDYNKNKIIIRKKRENSKPYLSKIIYKSDLNNVYYIYRYVTSKKINIYLLRCQDKYCRAKAYYNFESKEIFIYEDHSKRIQDHIYLSKKSKDFIKGLIIYMKNNNNISSLEIFSDNSKNIINNIKEIHSLKKEKNIEIKNNNEDANLFLNKKRSSSPIRFITSLKSENNDNKIFKFDSKKKYKKNILDKNKKGKNNIHNNAPRFENNIHNKIMNNNKNLKRIFNINKVIKEEFVNDKENYCEIKDKYLKHKQLLTESEQLCFGENRRLGSHFHKEKDGNIYNYFGNNKEIKDFNMNYRCTLKGCKGKAIYNMKFRKFTIISEHTKPYEEHYCSNPIDEKTKNWIIYLKNNEILSDLQIILI